MNRDKEPEAEMAETNQSKPFTIITHLKEVSKESFVQRFGKELISADPLLANAERIAEVELSSALFNPNRLGDLAALHLELFDSTLKQILVKSYFPAASGFSLQGGLKESPAAVFFLSVTEQQALGTLRLPDINTVYTVKYIYPAGRHYLFKGLITEVERYECKVKTTGSYCLIFDR